MAGKPIIGIAGGIGSGKSTVASILKDLGAGVIDSDRLNHEELNSPEVLAVLRQWWGESVVTPDGKADRDVIRGMVTHHPAALRRLEQLVHPRIARRSQELIAGYQADPGVRAIVWDAPLLYEAGLAERCDCVLFVDAAPEVRFRRVQQKRAWSSDDFQWLEESQKPLNLKRGQADYRVENNSDVSVLRRHVEDVFSRILLAT